MAEFCFRRAFAWLGSRFLVIVAEPVLQVEPLFPVLGRLGWLHLGDHRRGLRFAWLGRSHGFLRLGLGNGQRLRLDNSHDFRLRCDRLGLGLFGGWLDDHDRFRLRFFGGGFRDDGFGLHLLFGLRLRLSLSDRLRLRLRVGLRDRDRVGFEIFFQTFDDISELCIRIRHEGEVAAVRL